MPGHKVTARLLLTFVLGLWGSGAPAGQKPDPLEFFESKIRPLLVERCFKCHGGEKTKGGLELTSRQAILEGGENGPAALAGKPEASLLIRAVRQSGDLKMPPKERLSATQIEHLENWVRIGLPWPQTRANLNDSTLRSTTASAFTPGQKRFWSFQSVHPAAPPQVKDRNWPRSGIDPFILAKLEAHRLVPARAADKRTLIRRATFDLTGLPPTPREVEAFLADDSPEAFARVVDRLLASPEYGIRWGRHWLDVVRYTDSFDARIVTGPGSIMDVSDAYRYRDWVVEAFNRDLPFDEFIIHQIAGDLLPPGKSQDVNVEGIVATGMLAIGNWGGGDADKEKLLTDIADDQIDVVSRAFLGITMACARCHDHKFDPFTMEDYYGLAGIFFSCHILQNPGPKTDGPPMLRIPLVKRSEVDRYHERAAHIAKIEDAIRKLQAARFMGAFAWPILALTTLRSDTAAYLGQIQDGALTALQAELTIVKAKPLPPIPYANGAQEGGCPLSPQAGTHDVRVHLRGRYDRLGKLVPRRFPLVLAGDRQKPITRGSGRLELAQWIASPTNPLTARVIVNRVWQHHFGEGIVRTPGNFGKLGEAPTHPELLDYLADRLIHSGWSIKALHRAIMLSAAYQQSSVPQPESFQADPDNRLFGRMNRRRLEAEEIRDALLAAADRLDRLQGGPATQDFNAPRRTLYLMTIRSDRSSFRELFDAADPTALADKRVVSTVAPQALFLLNNSFMLAQVRGLAAGLLKSQPSDETGKIRTLYERLLGRPAGREEEDVGREFLESAKDGSSERAWEEYSQLLLCTNEFVYID